MTHIRGDKIAEGTRIKTWFMPGGTPALSIKTYRGPLAYLFPQGARIIGFAACTRSGICAMTVPNDERYELA